MSDMEASCDWARQINSTYAVAGAAKEEANGEGAVRVAVGCCCPKEAGAVEVALPICKCCGSKSCAERTTSRVVFRFRSSFSAFTRSSSWWRGRCKGVRWGKSMGIGIEGGLSDTRPSFQPPARHGQDSPRRGLGPCGSSTRFAAAPPSRARPPPGPPP